ncbi:MAG: 2-dehydropantoate 2-reductase [Candidatus Thermoplasmatota archaeon]|nr:2-dehydropantoate 2-reductase [Candidatus Thermoplasmatota archaeon]
MRVCVYGAGSLGTAIGGMLAAKNDVTLIGRDPHMSVTRREGLRLTGDVKRKSKVDARLTVAGLEPPELIIVTVKAYDTKGFVEACRKWAGPHTRVLTLQNGLGNLEMLREWKGKAAFGGTATMGAQLLSPGKVRVSGLGRTTIGADRDPGGAEGIVRMFVSCGLPAVVEEDISTEIWSKASVSACINPLTAILRVANGALAESDAVVRLVSEICRECAMVASAEGISITPTRIEARVWKIAEDTSDNRSSMLRDVEMGRRTEVEQINGAFAGMAVRHGISVPINRALTAMVCTLASPGSPGKH